MYKQLINAKDAVIEQLFSDSTPPMPKWRIQILSSGMVFDHTEDFEITSMRSPPNTKGVQYITSLIFRTKTY